MGGWVGASDMASTGRAEKAWVGGVGDTENHRLKTPELYRQAKVRNPARCRAHLWCARVARRGPPPGLFKVNVCICIQAHKQT